MCGFTGFIKKFRSSSKAKAILSKMNDSLSHRGPDDAGTWFDAAAGIGLAHRRLSIIDLSTDGRQPMYSPSKRFVIVYNGEIYNYKLLRKEIDLLTNIGWQSRSDTEVMLAAIDIWGIEEAISKFVGMFALALWDRQERILYLCRDRLGIKPLYYARFKNIFIFGSELKALKSHPHFQPRVDRHAVALYLRHNCIPAPYSIYQNTYKLEPGTILKIPADHIHSNRELRPPTTYWSAKTISQLSGSETDPTLNSETLRYQMESLLKEAVAMRMISDVPLGVFLSGGVDSSMITALMQSQSASAINTFTIGFYEEDYNEARHARAIAEHLGTNHTELYVSANEALAVIPDLPKLYDEPFSDASQIPTHLLSKLTRQHVTVCLSGDGGDELFGGYNRYRWIRKIVETKKILPSRIVEKAVSKALQISPQTWDRLFALTMSLFPNNYRFGVSGEKMHKLASVFSHPTSEAMYYRLVSHWQHPEEILLNAFEPTTKITARDDHPKFDSEVALMMYLDLVTYLPDDILTKVDRASMGVGLEVRIPFLDHRVVELAWKIPLQMKIHNGCSKWILREILYQYIPQKLIERPKAGFAIPLDSWLRGPLRDWAESLLDTRKIQMEGYFNAGPIQHKWKQHLSGKMNCQDQLWDILMFQAWLENE